MMQIKPWHKMAGGSAVAIACCIGAYYEGEVHVATPNGIGTELNICMGETHGVYPGMTATHDECVQLFSKEMGESVATVNHLLLRHQPNTRQAALADLEYNIGETAFARSSVLRYINLGDVKDGCDAILLYGNVKDHFDKDRHQWVYREIPGLMKRRKDEQALCLEDNGNE